MKQLIERELAVKDVAAGQPVRALEIERRDDLAREHRATRTRARSARSCASPRRRGARVRASQRRRRAGDMARTARTPTRRAVRRAPATDPAIDGIVSSIHGSSEKPPYFAASKARSIASMSAAEPDAARTARPPVDLLARRQPGEVGQRRDRVVHFRERAVHPDVLHAAHEFRREMERIDESEQRALRIGARTRRRAPRSARRRRVRRRSRRSSATSIRSTSAPVRISAPACRAPRPQRIRQRAGAARSEPARSRPDVLPRRRAAAGWRRCPPTADRETIRACRLPQPSRAAVRSRTTRPRNPPPPSASSATAGTRRLCRALETRGRSCSSSIRSRGLRVVERRRRQSAARGARTRAMAAKLARNRG